MVRNCYVCGLQYDIDDNVTEIEKQVNYCCICGNPFDRLSKDVTNYSDFSLDKTKRGKLLYRIKVYDFSKYKQKSLQDVTGFEDKIGYYIYIKPRNTICGKDGKELKIDNIKDSVDIEHTLPEIMFTVDKKTGLSDDAYDEMKRIRSSNNWRKGDVEVYYFDGNTSRFAFTESYNNNNRNDKTNKLSEMLCDGKEISSEEAYKLDVYNDILVDILGISQEAVDIVIGIMGKSQETYDAILQQTTGFRNLSQIED